MVLNVVCPQGHRLQVDSAHAGRRGRCPRCSSAVLVPRPTPIPRAVPDQLSDTGALRILGDYEPSARSPRRQGESVDTKSTDSNRFCPRCQSKLATSVSICTHCQTFVGQN